MFRMGKNPRVEPTPKEETPSDQAPAASAKPAPQTPPTPTATAVTHSPAASDAATPRARAAVEQPAAPRAFSESEAIARDIREGVMSGFVGVNTVLDGEVAFRGMLRVDGHITGRISSDKGTLIVSAGGRVEAHVAVAAAKINGTVHGDITATERIEFGRTAQVYGNIRTPALVIEQGAVFEGDCRMARPQAVVEQPRQEQQQKARPDKTTVRATAPSAAVTPTAARGAAVKTPVVAESRTPTVENAST